MEPDTKVTEQLLTTVLLINDSSECMNNTGRKIIFYMPTEAKDINCLKNDTFESMVLYGLELAKKKKKKV